MEGNPREASSRELQPSRPSAAGEEGLEADARTGVGAPDRANHRKAGTGRPAPIRPGGKASKGKSCVPPIPRCRAVRWADSTGVRNGKGAVGNPAHVRKGPGRRSRTRSPAGNLRRASSRATQTPGEPSRMDAIREETGRCRLARQATGPGKRSRNSDFGARTGHGSSSRRSCAKAHRPPGRPRQGNRDSGAPRPPNPLEPRANVHEE